MARPRMIAMTLPAVLVAGTAACGFPGGGGFCSDGQEGDDPRELSGTTFSTQVARCIEPDADEDEYVVTPNADGDLTVTCTTDVEDLVHATIDPSSGPTVDFACAPGGASESIELDPNGVESATVTFAEGAAAEVDQGEAYQLTIEFDAD